jgi:hypothetical protein
MFSICFLVRFVLTPTDSSLSIVPPVNPKPLPEILATGKP